MGKGQKKETKCVGAATKAKSSVKECTEMEKRLEKTLSKVKKGGSKDTKDKKVKTIKVSVKMYNSGKPLFEEDGFGVEKDGELIKLSVPEKGD